MKERPTRCIRQALPHTARSSHVQLEPHLFGAARLKAVPRSSAFDDCYREKQTIEEVVIRLSALPGRTGLSRPKADRRCCTSVDAVEKFVCRLLHTCGELSSAYRPLHCVQSSEEEMVSKERLTDWQQRLERMKSDFTASEFSEAVREIERLRGVLAWIAENGPDDAYDLRDVARDALKPRVLKQD